MRTRLMLDFTDLPAIVRLSMRCASWGVIPALIVAMVVGAEIANAAPPAQSKGRVEVPVTKPVDVPKDEPSITGVMRVPCDQVLAADTQAIDSAGGHSVDLTRMARRLGTSAGWVQRCLESYGRGAMRAGLGSAQGAERIDMFEDQEPEEVAPEDVDNKGSATVLYREHIEHVKPPPTPDVDRFDGDDGEE